MSDTDEIALRILGLVVGENDRLLPAKSGHGHGTPGPPGITVEAAVRSTKTSFLLGRAQQIANEMRDGHRDGDTSDCDRCDKLRRELENIVTELKPMLPAVSDLVAPRKSRPARRRQEVARVGVTG